MRLIDADAFMEYLGLDAEVAREENLGVIVGTEDLDRQPTAYDVDKVVERLEEMREEMLTDTEYDNDTVNHYLDYADLMIEVVKSGGIE